MSIYDRDWYQEAWREKQKNNTRRFAHSRMSSPKKTVTTSSSRTRGRLIVTGIILLLAFSVVRTIVADKNVNRDTAYPTTNVPPSVTDTAEVQNPQPSSSDYGINYYDAIFQGLRAYQTQVEVAGAGTNDTMEEVKSAFIQVVDEHPELFWLDGSMSISGINYGSFTSFTITPGIIGNVDQLPVMEQELSTVVNQITSLANNYTSDRDKALYAHDAIASLCSYDEDTYYHIGSGQQSDIYNYSYSAYGCLVEGKAVCAGYANAFKLIMDSLGIECGVVTGTATNSYGSGDHAWNYVILDGERLFIDVTWDDPLSANGGDSGTIRHDYFCLTEEQMQGSHHISYP